MFNVERLTKKRKNKFKWKDLAFRFFAIIAVILSISPTIVSASSNYFLTFTYNPQLRGIMPGIELSDVTKNIEEHAEVRVGANYLYNSSGEQMFYVADSDSNSVEKIGYVPSIDDIRSIGGLSDYFADDRGDYNDSNKNTLPFSFPGRHVPV